jgi:hypothetical protein
MSFVMIDQPIGGLMPRSLNAPSQQELIEAFELGVVEASSSTKTSFHGRHHLLKVAYDEGSRIESLTDVDYLKHQREAQEANVQDTRPGPSNRFGNSV